MYFSVFFYAVGKADFIRCAYVSARAVADKKAVVLHSAEQRDIILAVYGQSPVVFQQYAAVRRCLSQNGIIFSFGLPFFIMLAFCFCASSLPLILRISLFIILLILQLLFYFYVIISHTDCFVIPKRKI